jgi:hypothetical protein
MNPHPIFLKEHARRRTSIADGRVPRLVSSSILDAKWTSAAVALCALSSASLLLGQGTLADYQRGQELQAQHSGKLHGVSSGSSGSLL